MVDSVHAESFGEPGQRTFRIRVDTLEGQISLWLEKEQIVMVGTAIDEVLARVPDRPEERPRPDNLRGFVGDLEVRVGSLSIGYDSDRLGYSIEASDFESPFDLSVIALLAPRSAFVRLSEEIGDIVSASRPRCPLCGTPLTGSPHFCPPSNGHARLSVSD